MARAQSSSPLLAAAMHHHVIRKHTVIAFFALLFLFIFFTVVFALSEAGFTGSCAFFSLYANGENGLPRHAPYLFVCLFLQLLLRSSDNTLLLCAYRLLCFSGEFFVFASAVYAIRSASSQIHSFRRLILQRSVLFLRSLLFRSRSARTRFFICLEP